MNIYQITITTPGQPPVDDSRIVLAGNIQEALTVAAHYFDGMRGGAFDKASKVGLELLQHGIIQ